MYANVTKISSSPVWPDFAKLRHFVRMANVFGNFCWINLIFGIVVNLLWHNFKENFHCRKCPNVKKLSSHLVTLLATYIVLFCASVTSVVNRLCKYKKSLQQLQKYSLATKEVPYNRHEPWFSGNGYRLMLKRLSVWLPALNTRRGAIFHNLFVVNCTVIWKERKYENEMKKRPVLRLNIIFNRCQHFSFHPAVWM